MKIISKTNFSQISFLIQNVNYKNIYALLYQNLSLADSAFFSKIEQRNNEAMWYVDSDELKYLPFKDASPEEKSEIADIVGDKNARIESKILEMSEISTFAKQILTIPSEDQIFFAYDSNGNIVVTLAQWGCGNAYQGGEINLVHGLISVPRIDRTDVQLFVKYSDNTPAANTTFYFSFGEDNVATAGIQTSPKNTDTEGRIALGKLKRGVTFTLSNQPDRSDVNRTATVTEQPVIELIFPFYTSFNVWVVNQYDKPYAGVKVRANGIEFVTDSEGRFSIEKIEFFSETKIELALKSDPEKKASFDLHKDCTENEFKFVIEEDIPHVPEKSPIISTPEEEKPGKPINIKLLDLEGKPIPNTVVNVKTKKGMKTATTDDEGFIYLPASHFKHNEKVKVDFSIVKQK